MDQNHNTPPTSSSVTEWPGAFGAFKPSRDAIRRSLSTVVLLIVLNIVVAIILSIVFESIFNKVLGVWLNDLVNIAVSALFVSAQIFVYLSSLRGKRVELKDSFKAAQPYWGRMILLQLLVLVTVLGGFLLLIVPGIIFALRLSLSTYYLVDQDMGVMDAYKASWHATRGNLGKVWGLIGVNFLMILPSITIIGIIATIYLTIMYSASFGMLYLYLVAKQPAAKPKVAA